ncbi:MAG: GNAT family N-acetyltransferase [Nitrosospira sp.]
MNTYTVRVANWEDDGLALRKIRETVFIREQRIPLELEWDEFDPICLHLIAIDLAGDPIGTARLSPDGVIGRMAVLKEWRNQDVGSTLLLRLLEEARKSKILHVTLNAQLPATGFYGKFDFRIAGEEFMDAGIPHVRMILKEGNRPTGSFLKVVQRFENPP